MRLAMAGGLALLLGFAGAWIVARFELTDRVASVSRDAGRLCGVMRSGRAPSLEEIAHRFVDLAAANHLEASDVRVTSEPVKAGAGQGMAADIQGQLSAMTGGKLKVEATLIRVSGRLSGEKWLWSVDRPTEQRCTVQGKVERVGLEVPR